MNQTEAWEEVLSAADAFAEQLRREELQFGGNRRAKLVKALAKVRPRITLMRSRLDTIRARLAPRRKLEKGMPAWLKKATA
ncbi:MAG: hypothetical protein ACO1TE_14215 [Prosthecobacter sp.]